ncbi:MAG: twin-arginine translocase TatA/TatE family subunit [Thiolinea sp.]
MGFGGISPWSLLIILVIILLLFGTKRLRNMGGDLGGAFKSFKKSMKDEEDTAAAAAKEAEKVTHEQSSDAGRVIDAEVTQKDSTKS